MVEELPSLVREVVPASAGWAMVVVACDALMLAEEGGRISCESRDMAPVCVTPSRRKIVPVLRRVQDQ